MENLGKHTESLETLPKDVLYSLALKLPLSDLNNLCESSKKLKAICADKSFWRSKLIEDYGMESSETSSLSDPKNTYNQILENKHFCNERNLNTNPTAPAIYYLSFEDNFTSKNDYKVFSFLARKIITFLTEDPWDKNYYENYYETNIAPVNEEYGNIITLGEPSKEEFDLIFDLLERITKNESIDDVFTKSLAASFIRGEIPLEILWEELCQYNIY